MTIKEMRKAMRALASGETLLVPGWGRVQKLGHGYAVGPLPENDNSDVMRDYTDWTYGWREKWVLDNIASTLGIS